jgi:pyrimidine operon attenuation protein/uracil phosphoribosyltransferase
VMKLYDVFKKCVYEGIRYDSEEYKIDYEKDLVDDLIRFSDKISFKKDEYGNVVIIGIPIKKSEYKNKLLNDIKKGININPEDLSTIIDKIVTNLTEYVNLDDFDYVVSPKSSSLLTKSLIDKLSSLSNKPTFISDMFLKNDIDNIWLDIEAAEKELSNKFLKKLVKDFERSKGIEGQSMKLQPLTNFQRKYVRDMLKVNPKHNNILTDMLDKNILVIDDILTTGKTLNDIRDTLSKLSTGQIKLFTMFG